MSVIFSPAQQPIVPSQGWQSVLNFSLEQTQFFLQFPTSFVPAEKFLASTLICQGDAVSSSYNIVLPKANSGSVGNNSFIYNQSSSTIKVYANDGTTEILSIESGKNWVLELFDNSTTNGTWIFSEFGAITSQAQASALAGQGLEARENKLNVDVVVVDFSDPITITLEHQAVLLNWTGGVDTQALPTGMEENFQFYIKNSSSINGFITIESPVSTTIDGGASIILSVNESCLIITDGTNWFTVGLGLNISATGVRLTSAGVRVINGTVSLPSYSFITTPNTGFFLSGTGTLDATISGNLIGGFTSNGIDAKTTNLLWGGIPLLYFNNIYP